MQQRNRMFVAQLLRHAGTVTARLRRDASCRKSGAHFRGLAWFFVAGLGGLPLAAQAAPSINGCPIFPVNNYWNTRVDNLPVHPSSSSWVASIGSLTRLHPDWSNDLSNGFGFNIDLVTGNQPQVPITFTGDPAQTDTGPFPIPPAAVHGNNTGDREVVVVDTTRCLLYEMYATPVGGGTSWTASAMAKFDLMSNALRADGLLSADQAGLPFLPGLMRWEEVGNGEIAHAIRVTAQNIWGASGAGHKYIWPARHWVGIIDNPAFPPVGARFRLNAMFDISGYDPRTQIVLRAFKKYGLVLASGGGDWFLQGVSDVNWPNAVIAEIRSIAGGNFEAVDTLLLQIDPNSAQSVQFGTPPDAPTNLVAYSGSGQVTFTFNPSPSNAALPITGYSLTCMPGNFTAVGLNSPITVVGLSNGTTYACSASATNANGTGTASASVNVTPGIATVPDDGFPARAAIPGAWAQPPGSSASWFVSSDAAYAGIFSIKSGFVRAHERSEIYYTANLLAGNVSFARKVSSQPSVDFLYFFIDGVQQGSWSGDTGWSVVSFPIPGGTHTLLWRYARESVVPIGADAAWIDSIILPRIAPCPFQSQQRKCLLE